MILYLTAGLFGGYNETIKFEELGISTHSLTRRLTTSGWLAAFCSLFQLTASQGGWQRVGIYRLFFSAFQLTASQGGWQPGDVIPDFKSIFQLTASQGGWHCWGTVAVVRTDISTHSLTRRLTWVTSISGKSSRNFNSQPHKEADLFRCSSNFMISISTHSLTRRLTYNRPTCIRNGWYFNSQPHKEADKWCCK